MDYSRENRDVRNALMGEGSERNLQKEFEIRVKENEKITSKIDKSIDPSDSSKVKLAQQYFNTYVFQDDVLAVDGVWGVETQEAFNQYRELRKYSTSFYAGTDFRDLENRYLNNKESKRLKAQGALEIDDAMKEMNKIDAPLFE